MALPVINDRCALSRSFCSPYAPSYGQIRRAPTPGWRFFRFCVTFNPLGVGFYTSSTVHSAVGGIEDTSRWHDTAIFLLCFANRISQSLLSSQNLHDFELDPIMELGAICGLPFFDNTFAVCGRNSTVDVSTKVSGPYCCLWRSFPLRF